MLKGPLTRSGARSLWRNLRRLGHALHQYSLESGQSLQELAAEAFRDLLRKHRRPVTLRDALRGATIHRSAAATLLVPDDCAPIDANCRMASSRGVS
jgi:hypothetical protein